MSHSGSKQVERPIPPWERLAIELFRRGGLDDDLQEATQKLMRDNQISNLPVQFKVC